MKKLVGVDNNVDLKSIKAAFVSAGVEEPDFVASAIEGYSRFKNNNVRQVMSGGRPTWDDDLSWDDPLETWGDQSTDKCAGIECILGKNREDVIHFDTAVKNGCVAFLTNDNDFLMKKDGLEQLTGVKIFRAKGDNIKDFIKYIKELSD